MHTRTIETAVHGRFLFEDRGAERLVVAFHGYGETAEAAFGEIAKIDGIGLWSVAAVQALHPFYTRSGRVVASWMTSLDRELAIGDNIAYVRRVLDSLPRPDTLVFAGFSQGAAMAARAAAYAADADGLILLGGDIPPEIKADPDANLPPVLLGRGTDDESYSDEKFKDDLKFLETRTRVTTSVFSGGHEWSEAFREAAARFLRMIASR